MIENTANWVWLPSVPNLVSSLSWLSTEGGRIIDDTGRTIRLKSINWYGGESLRVPSGLWGRAYKTCKHHQTGVVVPGILDQIKALGYNAIRMPICEDLASVSATINTGGSGWDATYIDPWLNYDLFDPTHPSYATPWVNPQPILPAIQILDKLIEYAGKIGLRIILDMHCLKANSFNVAGTLGKWYYTAQDVIDHTSDPGVSGDGVTAPGCDPAGRTEQQWIDAWVFLAARYANQPAVCGADLINEPHNCTWGDGVITTDVKAAYERCANAIHAVNPNWLIVCEGITGNIDFSGGNTWGSIWSGNLTGVALHPVTLTVPNKVIYSPHEYGAYSSAFMVQDPITTLFWAHQWFYTPLTGVSFPNNMPEVWRTQWGYIAEQGIAPLYIGEFGADLSFYDASTLVPGYLQHHNDADILWLQELKNYCATFNISFAYWALNPSGDPNGLLSNLSEWSTSPVEYRYTHVAPFNTL